MFIRYPYAMLTRIIDEVSTVVVREGLLMVS